VGTSNSIRNFFGLILDDLRRKLGGGRRKMTQHDATNDAKFCKYTQNYANSYLGFLAQGDAKVTQNKRKETSTVYILGSHNSSPNNLRYRETQKHFGCSQ
jgi:hypothetical protein